MQSPMIHAVVIEVRKFAKCPRQFVQTQWAVLIHREPGTLYIIIVQVWPKGTLMEVVQNLVHKWEMELSTQTGSTAIQDYRPREVHNRFKR